MAGIEFRGKTYNSEFEMPYDVRQAYQREKERKPLSEIVDMSPEVKAIYERALGNVEEKLGSFPSRRDLPRTEDLYRQSAPDPMKHLPSDESIYQPSPQIIDPAKSTLEPEPVFQINRLVSSILWVLLLLAVVFIISRFLL